MIYRYFFYKNFRPTLSLYRGLTVVASKFLAVNLDPCGLLMTPNYEKILSTGPNEAFTQDHKLSSRTYEADAGRMQVGYRQAFYSSLKYSDPGFSNNPNEADIDKQFYASHDLDLKL
ncbi:hypothetical protein BpHYR1_022214 [Brachionus plicatilis]|uniref:Uncharacterized protein n=1 Tax=Brachionus plicatilis TaxID=10195 RepID=A0A3M7Q6J4_BRAPC|nr:hypothetical protein BpHYR1_022214 [Brachionus plicatilis]